MIPLAATSTDGIIRLLGGARWRLLHRLAYPAAILAVAHYLLQGKGLDALPLYYAAILACLLAFRIVVALRPS